MLDLISELQQALADLREEVATERASRERMFRKGKVSDVDPKKQLYRQEIGQDKDGKPVKSAWIPYGQIAGARKEHSPPSVGQQMVMFSPDGDFEQAFGIPLTWSKDNASPSDKGDEDVATRGASKDTTRADQRLLEVGKSSISIKDGTIVLKSGDTTLTIDGEGHHFKGPKIDHDDHVIDKTHKHKDTEPGGGLSGPPQ